MKKNISSLILCLSIISFNVFAKEEIVKTDDFSLTTHLQEETSLGLVKITIHNFCTPSLTYCEPQVVLNYKNQIINHKINYEIRIMNYEHINA